MSSLGNGFFYKGNKVMNPKGFVPIESYKKFMRDFPICTVDILLLSGKGETLLFKRNNHPYKDEYFTLGGRLLKNENPENCAIRQLTTESGITTGKKNLSFAGA